LEDEGLERPLASPVELSSLRVESREGGDHGRARESTDAPGDVRAHVVVHNVPPHAIVSGSGISGVFANTNDSRDIPSALRLRRHGCLIDGEEGLALVEVEAKRSLVILVIA
jgi:hypothetical protein